MSGTFRAAVFGANDGLVSNLSLVLGISASGVSNHTVLVTGMAGLLAGALSMGAGEYVSVNSQRELLQASTPDAQAGSALPQLDVDANELALVYRARGMSESEAQARATEVLTSGAPGFSGHPRDAAPSTDGQDAVGTGLGAAASSFCFFASGALVPVLPYLFGLQGLIAVIVAAVLVGAAAVNRCRRRFVVRWAAAQAGAASVAHRLRRRRRHLSPGTAVRRWHGLTAGWQISGLVGPRE